MRGIRIIGIPQTIDNDVTGTEITIGFDTAVAIVTEAIDRLHTTAEPHHRIMMLEAIGRRPGRLMLAAGMAGGADQILVPNVHIPWMKSTPLFRHGTGAGKNSRSWWWPKGPGIKILPGLQSLRTTGMNAVMKSLWGSAISWERSWSGDSLLKLGSLCSAT